MERSSRSPAGSGTFPTSVMFPGVETSCIPRARRACRRAQLMQTGYRPGASRRYAPRRCQFDSRRIYVRPRTGPVGGRPAAGSQRAGSLGSCATQQTCYSLSWDRQTDVLQYRLMPPPYRGGMITPGITLITSTNRERT